MGKQCGKRVGEKGRLPFLTLFLQSPIAPLAVAVPVGKNKAMKLLVCICIPLIATVNAPSETSIILTRAVPYYSFLQVSQL